MKLSIECKCGAVLEICVKSLGAYEDSIATNFQRIHMNCVNK